MLWESWFNNIILQSRQNYWLNWMLWKIFGDVCSDRLEKSLGKSSRQCNTALNVWALGFVLSESKFWRRFLQFLYKFVDKIYNRMERFLFLQKFGLYVQVFLAMVHSNIKTAGLSVSKTHKCTEEQFLTRQRVLAKRKLIQTKWHSKHTQSQLENIRDIWQAEPCNSSKSLVFILVHCYPW